MTLDQLKEKVLADGVIDEDEVEALRQSLWEDGKIDAEEVRVLRELRDQAMRCDSSFEVLFFMSIRSHVLEDGKIDADEAKFLREMLCADGRIETSEKVFLTCLKAEATAICPEFETLYQECID